MTAGTSPANSPAAEPGSARSVPYYLGSWPLLVMFEAFRYIKAFSGSRNIPGYSVRASPIRLERVATRPQRLFLCCRGLCVRRDGRRLIAPLCLRPT